MYRKESLLGLVGLVLWLAGSACGATILQCDIGTPLSPCVGDPDQNLKPGWILITTPDCAYKECEYRPSCDLCWKDDHPGGVTIEDVNGTCIDIHIDVGNHTTLSGRDRSCEPCSSNQCGQLAVDYMMPDDAGTVEDATFFLTFKNLSAGNYILISYHNNPAGAYWDGSECEPKSREEMKLLASVTVSGAVSSWVGDYDIPLGGLCNDSQFSLNPKTGMTRVRFTATGKGDVIITYMGKDEEGYRRGSMLNAFELLGDPVCCLSNDLNGDCRIDFLDFAIVAGEWLECDFVPASACDQ